MTGNHADAEDALSQSSLKAWQYLMDAPRDITCIKSWLTRLLQNHCTDIWKARQKHAKYTQGIANWSRDGEPMATPTKVTLIQQELGIHLQRAFHHLPPRLREPARLRFVYEMSYEDIATQLRLRADNVRKRVQQARVLLRQQLTAYEADGSGSMDLPAISPHNEPECISGENDTQPEILVQSAATCAFPIVLPNGLEHFLYLTLDHKPRRQVQKVRTFQKYIQEHPRGWKKHRALGDVLYAMGAWEDARASYGQVISRFPDCLPVWLRLGDILHALDKTDEAIATYERASTLACNSASRHHIDGRIAICRQRLDAAMQAFAAASTAEPDNLAHWHALALTQLQAAHPVEALQSFETILQREPDDLVALTYSHDALHVIGRYAEAQRRAAHAAELEPNNVRSQIYLANRLTTMGQGRGPLGKQSHRLIRRVLQLAPNSPEAHDALARYQIYRGELAQGITGLRNFTSEHPTSATGWYYLAKWQFRQGDIEVASSAMRHAYTLDPHRDATLRGMIHILLAAGQQTDLKCFINELCQRFPLHWRTWITAGHALLTGFGEKKYACSTSAHALQCQPHLAQAWLQHGRILALAGDHQEALVALETARQWLPTDDGFDQRTATAIWLGESAWVLNDVERAHQWWEEALALARQLETLNPMLAPYWQGKALAGLGHRDSARQAFQQALRQHPFYPVRQEIVEALAVLGGSR